MSNVTIVKLNSYIVDLCNKYNYKKSYYKNILKVLKNCFRIATDVYGFIRYNPTLTLKLPKIEEELKILLIPKDPDDDKNWNENRRSMCINLGRYRFRK